MCRMSDGQTGVEGDEEVEEGDRDGICCKSPGPETKLQVNCKRLPGGGLMGGVQHSLPTNNTSVCPLCRDLFSSNPTRGLFCVFLISVVRRNIYATMDLPSGLASAKPDRLISLLNYRASSDLTALALACYSGSGSGSGVVVSCRAILQVQYSAILGLTVTTRAIAR